MKTMPDQVHHIGYKYNLYNMINRINFELIHKYVYNLHSDMNELKDRNIDIIDILYIQLRAN